jgi:protein-disulfide isomerase
MPKNKMLIVGSIAGIVLLAFVLAAGFLKDKEQARVEQVVKQEQQVLLRPTAVTLGRDGAPVTVVEFFDPECESCRAFHPYTKMLLQEFDGKVQFVFRYAPFHANSKFAIQIIEAARKQNRYWETLELLYQFQPQWGDHHNPQPQLIWKYLPQVDGLNIEQIKADMSDVAIGDAIAQDVRDGQALGVRMTPSFFVNGKPLEEFGYEPLRVMIREALANP